MRAPQKRFLRGFSLFFEWNERCHQGKINVAATATEA